MIKVADRIIDSIRRQEIKCKTDAASNISRMSGRVSDYLKKPYEAMTFRFQFCNSIATANGAAALHSQHSPRAELE